MLHLPSIANADAVDCSKIIEITYLCESVVETDCEFI
jgi:hypothetical protein